MTKRAFRRQVEPEREKASYPTLDAVSSDRRRFLKHFGLGLLGASAFGGLGACDDREVTLGGEPTLPPPLPDGGVAPQPDLMDLSGVSDYSPPPPDGGIAPQPDIDEGDWSLAGVPTDTNPPTPDGGEVEMDIGANGTNADL